MACCALAAFIMGQVLLLCAWLRGDAAEGVAPAAAAWRLGVTAPPSNPVAKRHLQISVAGLVALVAALGLAGLAATRQPGRVELGHTGIYANLCGQTVS
jgi:hypothetical protein